MPTIHPEWQDIPEDEHVPVRDGSRPVEDIPTVVKTAQHTSRPIAALTGIALTLIAGTVFVMQQSQLPGQIASVTPEIHLESSGADPIVLRVAPGSNVTFINNDTVAHILYSDSLMLSDGSMLQTDLLTPGDSTTVTLSDQLVPGLYEFASVMAQNVTGSIAIETSAPPPVTEELAMSSTSMAALTITSSETSTTSMSSSSSSSSISVPGIPTNPHTVLQADTSTEPLHSGAPRFPLSQPQSGPGMWLVGVMSLGIMVGIGRKALAR